MERKNFILSLLILISFISVKASCQNEDAILHNLTKNLSEYTAKIPREEIFLHSDREEYISGEDFWFSIYLFDRKDLKLSGESKIVYVEVLDTANRPLIQKSFMISDGTGPGHFILPDTLSTGFYTVRAYTNWMKNFLPVNCFMKEIIIFNTLKNDAPRPVRHSLSPGHIQKNPDLNDNMIGVNYTADSLKIIFETSGYGESGNVFYMVAQTRGNLNYSGKMVSSRSVFQSIFPRENLMTGINQITVFDFLGKPVAERYILTLPDSAEKYSINAEKRYGRRGKINLQIKPTGRQDPGIFSISAYTAFNDTELLNIEDYMVFGSEFNTTEGNVSFKILQGKPQSESDSILSGLRSNWIRWNDILNHNFPPTRYPFEKEYHFLTGKVENGNMDTVLLCFPGKMPWFQYTSTDDKGNFTFKLHIDEEAHDLVLMTKGNGKKILPESSFPDIYIHADNKSLVREEIVPILFSKMGINYQVEKIFRNVQPGTPAAPLYKALRPVSFYGIPSDEIILSDFIELPDMNEIFIELIPDVSLRQRKTGYEILISDRINDRPFILKPELMIDGVLLSDASAIAGIPPELVEKIDVVKRKYLVGGYQFHGIVNVITKTADFSCIPMPDYMTRIAYRLAEPVPVFISRVYRDADAKISRIPDYRNTLYWNPSLSLNDTIEFSSSDNRTKCLINIQGVTGDGNPFSLQRIITVE